MYIQINAKNEMINLYDLILNQFEIILKKKFLHSSIFFENLSFNQPICYCVHASVKRKIPSQHGNEY